MKHYNNFPQMISASISFTVVLLLIRVLYSGTITYMFLIWNLFLALVPVFFSTRLLQQRGLKGSAWLILFAWLLFFPNAPYIVTDLFHFTERDSVPKWYDLMVLTSAVWNGILLGMASLMQVERFLARHYNVFKVKLFVMVSLVLCSYGIYLGRFLRFNSWDIITDPINLFAKVFEGILLPHEHVRTWVFTLAFASLLWLIYYSVKVIGSIGISSQDAKSMQS